MASASESAQSSVESSPRMTCQFIPTRFLKSLPVSQQVIPEISYSESESDGNSAEAVPTYCVSPRRPDKRQQLSVPSPRMAQLCIRGPPQ